MTNLCFYYMVYDKYKTYKILWFLLLRFANIERNYKIKSSSQYFIGWSWSNCMFCPVVVTIKLTKLWFLLLWFTNIKKNCKIKNSVQYFIGWSWRNCMPCPVVVTKREVPFPGTSEERVNPIFFFTFLSFIYPRIASEGPTKQEPYFSLGSARHCYLEYL